MEKQQYLERISELESQLSRQEVSGHGATGVDVELGSAHLQPAVYASNPTAIEECGQEQAETLSLQEVLLPEVRGNVTSYPCSEFQHMQLNTPPPRVQLVSDG